jgi:hypothetical protein
MKETDADPSSIQPPFAVLKSLWTRQGNGRWGVTDLKSIDLKPQSGFDPDYFAIASEMILMTPSPSRNFREMSASFGSTAFLMRQSVVPIVAWNNGDSAIRCIGTGSVVSCSGFVLTAAHVIMDPYEGSYGMTKKGVELELREGFNFGIFVPRNSAFGRAEQFLPIEKFWTWGNWKQSPLIHQPDRFDYLTDVALCKTVGLPDDAGLQPLNMSLHPFSKGEAAYAIGYAEMADIPLINAGGKSELGESAKELYVSIGEVMEIFPFNHFEKNTMTPGPCFDFRAKIPGKMSGAPIFGAKGAIVRGVVSRSFSNDHHASGAMLGPAMELPLSGPYASKTLRRIMEEGRDGIALVHGRGL